MSLGFIANKMPPLEIVAAGLISGQILAFVVALIRYLMGISGQTREEVFPWDYDTACQWSLASFKLFPNRNIEEAQPGSYRAVVVNNTAFIHQSYALTPKSMGWIDIITITVTPIDTTHTKIKLESSSDLNRTADLALSRGRHNVDLILDYLRRKSLQPVVDEQSEAVSATSTPSGENSPMEEDAVWVAAPWVVVLRQNAFHFQYFAEESARSDAAKRLRDGADIGEVFASPLPKLPLANVKAIERIAASNSVRWQANWGVTRWLVIPDEDDAKRLFRAVARRLPNAGPPTLVRGGIIDIPISQYTYLIAGIFITAFLLALYIGAVSGPDRGQANGIEKVFIYLTRIGQSLGLIGVVIINIVVVIAIAAILAWARRFAPMKKVLRVHSHPEEEQDEGE